MKVIKELLERYNFPEDYITNFEKFFPNGIEFLDLIEKYEVPFDKLHLMAKYFDLSDNERNQYRFKCEVYNSDFVFSSENVKDSSHILRSNDVNMSKCVQNSSNISKSNNIYMSRLISNSQDVFKSNNVSYSNLIFNSNSIKNSSRINYCHDLNWCQNMMNSSDTTDSIYSYYLTNSQNCLFSGFLKNCTNCICCIGLEDASYKVCNQDVSITDFENLKEKLTVTLESENNNFIVMDAAGYYPEERYSYTKNYVSIFDGLSDSFLGKIGDIKEMTDEIFWSLFFRFKIEK